MTTNDEAKFIADTAAEVVESMVGIECRVAEQILSRALYSIVLHKYGGRVAPTVTDITSWAMELAMRERDGKLDGNKHTIQ